jgi:hypothetical protein
MTPDTSRRGLESAVSATKLKAEGPSILRIGFDPGRLRRLRHAEVEDIAYHIARVLTGEASAVLE